MSIVISPSPPVSAQESTPKRIRFTRRMCTALVENGLLTGRYELIDGEVIDKMGQNPPHAFVIRRLNGWLVKWFGADYVNIQLPIDVSEAENETNEPEPDAAVLAQSGEAYLNGNPGPSELLLVIEVSDSSLYFDLHKKAALYARATIQEYWVVDIAGRRMVVHRQPTSQGYAEILAYGEDELLSPLARPEATIRVADLLPTS